MMRRLLAAVLVWGLCSVAWAEEPEKFQINSGAMPCDGYWHDTHYTNDTGDVLYLTSMHWWKGLSRGLIADVLSQITLSAPGQPAKNLGVEQFHKYEKTDNNFDVVRELPPGGVAFPAGGVLTLQQQCVQLVPFLAPLDEFPWVRAFPAQHVEALHIWYVRTRP